MPLLFIISTRRWRPRRGGFRDRPLEAILVCAPTLSKASSRVTRDHPISGIMVNTLSVHRTHSRMAINAPSSRVVSRHHDRGRLRTLPRRLVPLALPTSVSVVVKKVTYLIIAQRSPTSKPPRGRITTRSHRILGR